MPRLTADARRARDSTTATGQRLHLVQRSRRASACRLLASGVRSPGSCSVRLPAARSMRITLGPVGTLLFEGPSDAARSARPRADCCAQCGAARRGPSQGDRTREAAARRDPRRSLESLWRRGPPAPERGAGFKRPSSISGDGASLAQALRDPDRGRARRRLSTRCGRSAGSTPSRGPARQSHALIMLKGLLSFGASRGLCDPHKITLTAKPSRKVQNFLKPTELKRLDAALLKLATEQPERVIGFSAIRLLAAQRHEEGRGARARGGSMSTSTIA